MSAANDIRLMCEAVLHFDEEGLKRFDYVREELYDLWTNAFVDTMKTTLQGIFSEKYSGKIGDIIISTLKKVTVETEEVDTGKVQVSVKGVNIQEAFGDKNWQLDVDAGVTKDELAEAMLRIIAKKFDALQPVRTTVFVVDCAYYKEGDLWGPRDMPKFLSQLFVAANGEQ